MDVKNIYSHRFSSEDNADMRGVWQVLVRDYFQRFVRPDARVLDLGAGYCHFINEVRASRKVAFDANPDVARHAGPGVEAVVSSDLTLPMFGAGEFTHVFMSNFLEHLPSSNVALDLLGTLREKLGSGGLVLILQPNFRYVGPAYFDFVDHHVIWTERSLEEALDLTGFSMVYLKKQFLPYTSKSRIPRLKILVRLYVRLSILHRILGKQTFMVGRVR